MIYKSKWTDLTCKKLLEEMHNQWHIARNKSHHEKDSDNEDEVVATATEKESHGKKKPYVDPDKEKTCNHCKKKGHVESKCWKKNPDLISDKVKAARKKQAEKKSKKATAAVNNEMILILDRQEFNINDTFTSVPTDKSIVYLKNIYEVDDKPPVTALKPSEDRTYDLDLSPSAVANVIADTDFSPGAHVLDSPDIYVLYLPCVHRRTLLRLINDKVK
jgi:hypothetical protein